MNGNAERWGDTENLLALVVDQLNFLTDIDGSLLRAWAPKARPKPPKPIPRPWDNDATVEVGLSSRREFRGGSLSIEELDRLIEEQTGAPHGIIGGGATHVN